MLAYEYYPSVAQKFARRKDVDGLMLPRMFQWVTNTWSSNRAPTAGDVTAAFGDCAIDDCLGCLTPTPEELVSAYHTTVDFVDSAPDAVTIRVLELWRQGQTVICSEHPLESPSVHHMHSAHSTPSVQHTPSAHASPDVFGTRPGDLNRSRSSTSSPMRTGPRVHFGLNPSRRPSPLEHRFERRLTALEDSVTSMHVRMSAEFLDIRASIRSINQALVDLKSSLTEQIRACFAEMRSNMPVQQDNDYSITYTRGRKRKASEADFGVDDNLAREIGSTSQTLHKFEPNLPVITEESSEDIQVTPDSCKSGGEATTSRGLTDNLCREIGSSSQTQQIFEPNLQAIPEESAGDIKVTPDARMSGGEATTSRDAGVRSLGETVTLKVNNSLARVRASMLDRSPSRIRGFYAEYEKSFYGPMDIANSRVTLFVSF
ncbi:uncharacterized protein [Primulina eburnea]|uniref:uncharacterized protein n=1 Tax=Primulina eburnea TaxID=1245227 RepID=UPI003C6C9C5D